MCFGCCRRRHRVVVVSVVVTQSWVSSIGSHAAILAQAAYTLRIFPAAGAVLDTDPDNSRTVRLGQGSFALSEYLCSSPNKNRRCLDVKSRKVFVVARVIDPKYGVVVPERACPRFSHGCPRCRKHPKSSCYECIEQYVIVIRKEKKYATCAAAHT